MLMDHHLTILSKKFQKDVSFIKKKKTPSIDALFCRHPFSGRMTTVSNGSGFIVREDGLILTNAHVVANKQNVVVKLYDGRSLQGRVQAVDEVSDLATIKVDAVSK